MLMLEKFYTKWWINFLLVYIHWVMRLLPSIVLVAFAIITFWDIIGTGPFYEQGIDDIWKPCMRWIWAKFLFIGEWLPGWKCMAWTWYIDNDMVFFFFLPFLVILYIKWWTLAYFTYLALIVISIVYTFTITIIEDLGASMTNDWGNINAYIYWRPWGWFGVYIVSVMIGCMYFEYWNVNKHPEL